MGELPADIDSLVLELTKIEHGFKHITEAGDKLRKQPTTDHFEIAQKLIRHDRYQGRMLGTYLLGILSPQNSSALGILKTEVSKDTNWRVQEMLAKAFDHYARTTGYERTLPVVREWLADANPNVVRAVIEGLRIWTNRPYFKEHPAVAIELISRHKGDESEYVRKSVGNALRDIRRKHMDLIEQEVSAWDLTDPKIVFTQKLIVKNG